MKTWNVSDYIQMSQNLRMCLVFKRPYTNHRIQMIYM